MSVNPEQSPEFFEPAPLDVMQHYGDSNLNVALRFEYYKHAEPPLDPTELLEEELNLTGTETILDAGCSNGAMLMGWREKGHTGQLIGLDISESLFLGSILRDDPETPRPINFIVGSVESIPMADSSVDISTAMFVLYHCDPLKGLQELKRVTKPGGTIVVATSSENNKRIHRVFEQKIAEKLGCSPPPRFNESFDTAIANELLPQVFHASGIKPIPYKGTINLKRTPGDPQSNVRRERLEDSLLTMRDSMDPVPDYADWKKALEATWEQMDREHATSGYYDDVERDFYFCINDKD